MSPADRELLERGRAASLDAVDDAIERAARRRNRDVWAHPDGSRHSADGPLGCFPCANARRSATMTRMSGRITKIGALKIADPVAFELELRRAMTAADGRIPVAAEALAVSVRQLSRWLAELPDVPRAKPGRPWPKTPR